MSFILRKAVSLAPVCCAALLMANAAAAQSLPCPPVQIQRLIPACQDRGTFGESVSVLNDRLAVGRYDSRGGRVTIHSLDPANRIWKFEADLRPTDLNTFDAFGQTVAMHYDAPRDRWLLAAGSPSKSNLAQSAGKAYVYVLDAQGRWIEQAGVLPHITLPYEWFGRSVTWATASERTFLIVGAPGSPDLGVVGSVYIFEQDLQGIWRQQAHLQASDGVPDNGFGRSLSAAEHDDETILLVGAPACQSVPEGPVGAAYAYRFDRVSEEWVLEATLKAHVPVPCDRFGSDVTVVGLNDTPDATHRIAIGARGENRNGSSLGPGGVYIYRRLVGGVWEEETRIPPPVPNPTDIAFGHSVHFAPDDPNRVLAGAVNSREFGPESGSAYLVERDATTGQWSANQALFGREQDGYDAFAVDVALGSGASADMAVVGALATQCPGGSQFDAIGAVYVFDLDPGEPGNCPPPVLTLQKVPDCSGGPGGEIEVRWFQATPDRRARIAILLGRRTGNFVIPDGNSCAGTRLGLGSRDLQVAFIGSAGPFGAGRLVTNVPRAVCGAHLQLIDITRCKTSNVVRIE